jgi:hypothetical protein
MAPEPPPILLKGAIRPSKPLILPPKRAPRPLPPPPVPNESDVDESDIDELDADESDTDKSKEDESNGDESNRDKSDIDESDMDNEIPPPKPHIGQGPKHDIGTRVQALSLFEHGVPILQIVAITIVSQSSIYRLRAIAISRGYNPEISKKILAIYVEDALTKTSRKPIPQGIVDLILQIVTKNLTTRSYSCWRITQEVFG